MTEPVYYYASLFSSKLKENTIGLFSGCIDRVQSTYSLFTSLMDTAEQPEIKLDLLDPSIRENALKILNITEEDQLEPERVFQIYQNLILRLEDKQRRVTPIFARAYGRIIVNVKSAYLTLGGRE